MINRFNDEYSWLSNFYKADIFYNGLVFPSTENAYQSSKSSETSFAVKCSLCEPNISKRLGKKPEKKNPLFEKNKVNLMYELNLQKYEKHEDLRNLLIATGNKKIVEGNLWHDNFYGNCTCNKCININGKNHLGKIIMEIRNIISWVIFILVYSC